MEGGCDGDGTIFQETRDIGCKGRLPWRRKVREPKGRNRLQARKRSLAQCSVRARFRLSDAKCLGLRPWTADLGQSLRSRPTAGDRAGAAQCDATACVGADARPPEGMDSL